jgi:hypothetical protein
MVMDGFQHRPVGNRAQLVLIGAVAIAFVLIGLVVLFNGVVFTENVSSEGGIADAKSSGTTTLAVKRGLGEAAHTVHTRQKYDDSGTGNKSGTLSGNLEDIIEEYDEWRRIQSGESRGVITNVTFEGIKETGTRVVQNEARTFTPFNSPFASDELIEDSEVDEFEMRIDQDSFQDGTDGAMEIVVDNGTEETSIIIKDESDTEITISGDAASGDCSNIEQTGPDPLNDVVLRISDGYVVQRPQCTFTQLSNPSETQTIRIEDGDRFEGTYEFVTEKEISSGFDGYHTSDTSNEPDLSQIAWSADYDITIAGPTATQELDNLEVDHYG